jgi:hypothetical protein
MLQDQFGNEYSSVGSLYNMYPNPLFHSTLCLQCSPSVGSFGYLCPKIVKQ